MGQQPGDQHDVVRSQACCIADCAVVCLSCKWLVCFTSTSSWSMISGSSLWKRDSALFLDMSDT